METRLGLPGEVMGDQRIGFTSTNRTPLMAPLWQPVSRKAVDRFKTNKTKCTISCLKVIVVEFPINRPTKYYRS